MQQSIPRKTIITGKGAICITEKLSPRTALRILGNLEVSIKARKVGCILLTVAIFSGYQLYFIFSSWFITNSNGMDGTPNLFAFGTMESMASALRETSLLGKSDLILRFPLYSIASYAEEGFAGSRVMWAFQLEVGRALSLLSLSFLISIYVNLWVFAKRQRCLYSQRATKIASSGGLLGLFSNSPLVALAGGGCCSAAGGASLLSVMGVSSLGFFGLNFGSIASVIGMTVFMVFMTYTAHTMKLPRNIVDKDRDSTGGGHSKARTKGLAKGLVLLLISSSLLYAFFASLLRDSSTLVSSNQGFDPATYLVLVPTSVLLAGFAVSK